MPPSKTPDSKPRVVVLGAGFAGAYCAREVLRKMGNNVDLLVIDQHNYFIFYPLLVDAGVGNLEPRHAIVPIRDFLTPRARFRMAELTRIDVKHQRVWYQVNGEEQLRSAEYDHLVIALGSVTNLPPVPGLRQHGWQVKTLADSVMLRDRAVQLLEKANLATDEARRRALLHLIVVGGNFTGVEVAGEFGEFIKEGARRYRNLSPDMVNVTLVEKTDRILPTMRRGLSRFAKKCMKGEGIDIRLNETVAEIGSNYAVLGSGERIAAHTVVWCAGIAQNPLVLEHADLPTDQRGYLKCEPDGRVAGFDNVWAIGDTAANPNPEGGVYPATAQSATRLGKQCAANIARTMNKQPTRAMSFREVGSLCSIGNHNAVAMVMGVSFSGFIAWWLWRTVYLFKMPGLSRKVRVALDWTVGLFFSRDYSELGLRKQITQPEKK